MPAVETLESLAALPERAWRSLADGSSFYSSHGWLLAAEDHDDFSARYAVARDGAELLAALPLYYAAAPPHNESYDPWATVVRQTRPDLGPGDVYPALLAGSRSGYTNDGVLMRPRSATGSAAARMLLGAAADLLRAGDVRSLTFPYLTSPALADVRALLPGELAGVPAVAADPDAVLRLPGAGFDDYLAAFRSGRRRAIRRELAAFERAGYRIEIGGLHGQAAALAPLLAAVQGRHGASDSVQRMRRYLVAQERAFGDQATVFRCLRGDRLAGFSLFYEHGDALWGRVAGLDYAQAERDAAVYFNVACYAPIRHAYRRGLRRVHWGPGSYDAKVFRGADLAERWSVTLLSSAVGPRAERTAHSAR